jgi:hypothetical protein
MEIENQEYQLFEIYSNIANKERFYDSDVMKLLQDKFYEQQVDFSRIEFKPFRDEVSRSHDGYAIESHDGKIKSKYVHDGLPNPNKMMQDKRNDYQEEKHYTRQMYLIDRGKADGHLDPCVGRIVDYEIPVKRSSEPSLSKYKLGKIDLMTETRDHVYLVEAKSKHSREPLHKAVFEIITYLNMISRTKLIHDYNNAKRNAFQYTHSKHDIKPAIMIYKDTKPYHDLRSLNPNSLLGSLILHYGVKFFILENHEYYGNYDLVKE